MQVGQAEDHALRSGVTCITSDAPFVAAVDVRGGAPGTRETDLLAPDRLVDRVDALVLSGGSAFGLDAASGVVAGLLADGRGWPVGARRIPIVPAAILYDLGNGGDKDWTTSPYPDLGRAAYARAGAEMAQGSVGAGTGASAGRMKGGLGTASQSLPNGATVGALVAANPIGTATVPESPAFWAAPWEIDDEFGGHPLPNPLPAIGPSAIKPVGGIRPLGQTTIAVVATDMALTKPAALRMAVAAQDGLARAIQPAHTPFDGDLVFAMATGRRPAPKDPAEALWLGHAAACCLARAIARAVFSATARPGDSLPTWRTLWG